MRVSGGVVWGGMMGKRKFDLECISGKIKYFKTIFLFLTAQMKSAVGKVPHFFLEFFSSSGDLFLMG